MRWLIYALATLAALVLVLIVAPQMIGDKGYVLIKMGNTAIEMSVVSLGITLVMAAVGWWLLKKVFFWFSGLFKGSHRWFGSLGERRRQRAFYRGLQALAEGDLHAAKKALQMTTEGDFDGVNYLAAAQVARALNEPDRIAYLLEQAADYPNSKLAATLVMARQELEQGDADIALKRLNDIEDKTAQSAQVITLKAQAMAALGHWQELETKLGAWRKILGEDYINWAKQIAKGKFAEIASKQGANALKQHWETLPRKLRSDDAYRAAYVQQLIDQGMHHDAQACLLDWQKKAPHPALLPLIRQLQLNNPATTVSALERWIKQDEKNAELYSVLGQLAFNSGDDVLAEKALLKAIKLRKSQQDLMLLAEVQEHRQDSSAALSYYKEGMAQQHP